ncbi:CPBP family intramembrane glutamic endopeptidase [Nonomuraea candida]|uniref:CPBP family intramembrane glutamic endopeptidase n=1 Tax=Nonomuraea candida TaxID=359159 RepID=UPI0012FA4715|nr:type II CAAX endopeptidase family protein [Nonomuraea candida]
MRAPHPVWTVLIAVAVMFAQVFLPALPLPLLLDPGHPLFRPLGTAGVTLASLGLIYLVRRFVHRRSWRGAGFGRSWRAVPQLLAGVLAGTLAVVVAGALSVLLGVATWGSWDLVLGQLPYLPLAIVIVLLGQSFPEELLWRGHAYDMLADRLSPRAVLVVTSVAFGALHIISRSQADTLAERLLFVVQAVALGFLCGAARARTGTIWAAVGAHTGFHLGHLVLPAQDVRYGLYLVILTCALGAAGLLLLRRRADGESTPRSGEGAPRSGEGAAQEGRAASPSSSRPS